MAGAGGRSGHRPGRWEVPVLTVGRDRDDSPRSSPARDLAEFSVRDRSSSLSRRFS